MRSTPADKLIELVGTLPAELQKSVMIRALKGASLDQQRAAGLLPGRLNILDALAVLSVNRHALIPGYTQPLPPPLRSTTRQRSASVITYKVLTSPGGHRLLNAFHTAYSYHAMVINRQIVLVCWSRDPISGGTVPFYRQ